MIYEDEQPSEATLRFKSTTENRTAPSTKQCYQSKLNVMRKWVKNHPQQIINNNYDIVAKDLKYPLPLVVLQEFFGSIMVKASEVDANGENNGKETMKAVSTIGGYKSALKAEYRV